MDKTETYIKMCDCVEIQGRHVWADEGDWYYYENDCVGVLSYHMVKPIREQILKGQGVVGRIWWLSTQDQLQEMENPKGFSGFIDWRGWLDNIYPAQENPFDAEAVRFHSWEQLWLAFIMSELYSKHWNGEEWIT